MLTRNSHAIDPPYPVYGGLFRKEAIMLLRRFYIQENEKGKYMHIWGLYHLGNCSRSLSAPKPRPKKNRELNTSFEGDAESFDYTAYM